MPTTSPAQHRLMEAAAHTKGGYGGVSQAVGREFVGKDAKLDTAISAVDALASRVDALVAKRRGDALNGDPGPVKATVGVRKNGDGYEGYVSINGEPYWTPGTKFETRERALEHAKSWQAKVRRDYIEYQRVKAENNAKRRGDAWSPEAREAAAKARRAAGRSKGEERRHLLEKEEGGFNHRQSKQYEHPGDIARARRKAADAAETPDQKRLVELLHKKWGHGSGKPGPWSKKDQRELSALKAKRVEVHRGDALYESKETIGPPSGSDFERFRVKQANLETFKRQIRSEGYRISYTSDSLDGGCYIVNARKTKAK